MNIIIFYQKILKILTLRNIILIITFSLNANNTILAQNSQDVIKEQDWISRQQQNILEDKQRENEIKNENEKQNNQLKNENATDSVNINDTEIFECIKIKEIKLIQANSISNYQQQKLTSNFIGKCINADTLSTIIKTINDYYYEQGIITTQIKVPNQNLKSGIFELKIIEGIIEKIDFNKNSFLDKMQKFSAFGNTNNKVLNINDINQGIYQINRLHSNNAILKIKPGSDTGKSIVEINNSKKFPAKFTLTNDNLGNEFTGIYRTNFTTNLDNLFSFNDNLNINYTTNLYDNNNKKNIESISTNLIIPFKYSAFSYDFYHSKFKAQSEIKNSTIQISGYSQIAKINFDHTLTNKSFLKLSLNSSLTQKSSAAYLNGSKLTNSQRRLSILNLGFTTSLSLNNFNIIVNPSYSKGLKILDAKKDLPSSSKNTAKAQFDVFKIYANFSKKIILPNNYGSFNLTTETSGQYSKQTLFGSEQFSVGGYFSVRGFRENYINGDLGYNIRNKLTFNLGQLLASFSNLKSTEKKIINLHKFSIEPFYDYGYVKNKYIDNSSSGRLSGAGLKTLFNSKYFNTSLTYSWAINKSKLITSNLKENKLIYFEVNINCC